MTTATPMVEIGPLQAIIERRRPDSEYHKKCMAVLDRSLPASIHQLLESRLAIVEAEAEVNAEEERQPLPAYASLVFLNAMLLQQFVVSYWNSDVWKAALNARDLASMEEHLDRLPDNSEYEMLRRAVASLIEQNIYLDCLGSTTETNAEFYFRVLLTHVEITLKCLILHLSGDEDLPDDIAEYISRRIEVTVEEIIRDATA